MKLFNKTIAKTLLVIAVPLSAGSCVADRDMTASDGRRSGEVRLGAYIDDVTETRAQGATFIKSGTYYMTYPNYPENTTHSVCRVTFHDGVGVTTTQNNKELKWEEIGSLTYNDLLTNFFLDNVAPPEGIDPNETVIRFTDSYHPFDAAVYAGDGGYNDLLWGYAFVDLHTSAEINIGIHHYLSRVSVMVTVDNTSENAQKINFDKGSVKITNVIKKGESYTRTDGRISLGDNPKYEDLALAVNGGWESVDTDETNEKISYYQTKNFVLPPQALRTDEERPRLVLDVPQSDGSIRTYSGVIPRVMMVNGSPAALAFDPEKNLTLKVKISQDRLRIESIAAYVQDWVNKGTFSVRADHAYIGNTEDLMDLIAIYQEQDYEQIKQYGYRHMDANGVVTWSFNIFGELEIEVEKATEKMREPSPDFSFDMTSHYFTLIYDDGTKRMFGSYDPMNYEAARNAETILHDLLRFGTVPDPKDGTDPNNGNGGGDVDVEIGVGDN